MLGEAQGLGKRGDVAGIMQQLRALGTLFLMEGIPEGSGVNVKHQYAMSATFQTDYSAENMLFWKRLIYKLYKRENGVF